MIVEAVWGAPAGEIHQAHTHTHTHIHLGAPPPPPPLPPFSGYWYQGRYVIYIGGGGGGGYGTQTYFTGGCFGCGRHCIDSWRGAVCCPACEVLYTDAQSNFACRPLTEYEWFYQGGGRCVQDANCEACQYWDPSYSACIIAPTCDAPAAQGK